MSALLVYCMLMWWIKHKTNTVKLNVVSETEFCIAVINLVIGITHDGFNLELYD